MPLKSTNLTMHEEDHWIPLSDLMTGMMMFFLLLSVLYMVQVKSDSQKLKDVAIQYDLLRNELYNDLEKEFSLDLIKWGAEINKDLTIRFKEPDVLFDTGLDTIKPKFKTILDEFFPRYVRILSSPKYKDSIEEIRVEGHTSSFWKKNTSPEIAYFKNMELSQSRTRTTLQYILTLPAVQDKQDWLKSYFTANGLSSSKLMYKDGNEDSIRSQRVEFRVRTNAESKIDKILNITKQ